MKIALYITTLRGFFHLQTILRYVSIPENANGLNPPGEPSKDWLGPTA
jgi:hypothetical protein